MACLENVIRFRNERCIAVDNFIYQESDEKASAGDIVLTLENGDYWGFVKNDSFYKVLHVDSDGDYIIVNENNNIEFLKEEDVTTVFKKSQGGCEEEKQEQQPANTPKFKIGDRAVVIGDNSKLDPHHVEIGTVVTVTELQDTEGRYGALGEGQICSRWYMENDLRPATESDLKWAELGRRVGEFKEGDIVKADGASVGLGEVIDVLDECHRYRVKYSNPRFNTCAEPISTITLVAPVESVVNLKAALE